MKVLTLTQPWATLVAIGAKRVETRSWKTNYRGLLGIHAAKGWTPSVVKLFFCEPFKGILNAAGFKLFSQLPRGVIIATAMLVDIHGTTDIDVDDQERFFGDYSPGRFAWELKDIQEIHPIQARGSLGLWEYNQ